MKKTSNGSGVWVRGDVGAHCKSRRGQGRCGPLCIVGLLGKRHGFEGLARAKRAMTGSAAMMQSLLGVGGGGADDG
jgi:hypothetical protein